MFGVTHDVLDHAASETNPLVNTIAASVDRWCLGKRRQPNDPLDTTCEKTERSNTKTAPAN